MEYDCLLSLSPFSGITVITVRRLTHGDCGLESHGECVTGLSSPLSYKGRASEGYKCLAD
jgi:hypothetical protein